MTCRLPRARTAGTWMATAAVALGLLAGFGLPAGAAPAGAPAAAPTKAVDLATLQAQLAQVTAQAEALSAQLDAEASRTAGLRIAMDQLAEQHDAAQAALDARVREVYIHSGPPELDGLRNLANPGYRALAQRAGIAKVGVQRELVDAVSQQSDAVKALRAESDRVHEQLRVQAAGVLDAQDRARDLLAEAEVAAAQQAEAAQRAAQLAALAAARARLDVVSAQVTLVLTPAQTARSKAALAKQGPFLALIDAAGAGYPAGYRQSGQVLVGEASWYGPGFVGDPTASGAAYDPELLTCAHKTLPLYTVLHVTANGRAVNCLVTDRGPYVGDRILDLSRAGSRTLGYSGVAQVRIEVLQQG